MDGDEIINERPRLLAEYVNDLRGYRARATSFKVYQDNKMFGRRWNAVCRSRWKICLDIGRRLIALDGFRYPVDNQDVFRVLYEEQIVSGQLLSILLEMASFRDLIVHNYARIDDARVYGILKRHLGDFDAFAEAIVEYPQPQTKTGPSESEQR